MKSVNSDLAYEYIRKRILSGEYPPGYALMTEDLAEKIGVSRTPIRDALRQLEADGLVTIRARLGASVKSFDIKEFRDMCYLRLALESYAAGMAALNRTAADLQEIGAALEAMRRLTDKLLASDGDQSVLGELIRADIRFHVAIMTATKNELLKKEILRLHLINRVVSGAGRSSRKLSPEERAAKNQHHRDVILAHEEVYRAIERGDASAARESMERQIQDIIDNRLRLLAQEENGSLMQEIAE